MLHGIGSHSYCYRDLMRLLAEKGFTVYAMDWPGHGASDKVRMVCAKFLFNFAFLLGFLATQEGLVLPISC
jgi:alpha-beta hydrolase superfamily lysophospholipase